MIRKMLLAAVAAAFVTSEASQAATPSFVVFFPEWSGALDDAALAVLRRAADAAHDPAVRLTVTGYADNKGSQAANQDLSQLRAQVVVDALVADGTAAAQISTGPSGPLPASGVIGRRVEIAVTPGR